MTTFNSLHFDQVLAYWKSVAKTGAPSPREFDFVMIPAALPDITFWELHEDGRIICRMAGTGVISRMKTDIAGVDLRATTPANQGFDVLHDFKTMQSLPCGMYHMTHNQHPSGKIARLETLTLPIAPDRRSLPKFVCVNHMMETVGYDAEDSSDGLKFAKELEERKFIDLGWGVPSVKNAQQITG